MDRTRAPMVAISLTVLSLFGAMACSRSAPYAAPPARQQPVYEQPVDEQPVDEQPVPNQTPAGEIRSFYGQRTGGGFNPTISVECYSFYPDGTVELRHGGLPQLSDRGVASGSGTRGRIDWESGRRGTVVVSDGTLVIDGLKLTPIGTCVP